MTDVVTRDLSFSTPAGERVGFLAAPPSSPRGAIVVVHEIFGRSPEVERAAERLARAGFAALMPDLFGERFKPLCIRRALLEVQTGQGEFTSTVRAAADALARETGIPREKVCVIGFCMGAGLALAVGNAFAAVSTNYGDIPPVDVLKGIGPTIACYGGRDKAGVKQPVLLKERLGQLGVKHEVHMFENAGHAFLCDGKHPVAEFLTRGLLDVNPVRDAGDREAAWLRIIGFLVEHAAVQA